MVRAYAFGLVVRWFEHQSDHTLVLKIDNLVAVSSSAGHLENSTQTGRPVSVYYDWAIQIRCTIPYDSLVAHQFRKSIVADMNSDANSDINHSTKQKCQSKKTL